MVVFSLDAGPQLDTHAFSVLAALSSVVHFSQQAERLRFVIMLTVPKSSVQMLSKAMCAAVTAAIGDMPAFAESTLPMCHSWSFVTNETRSCAARERGLGARLTFVDFPQGAKEYPEDVRVMLELLCCAQRRYSIKRPELATSIGNHARFFAHLALLPAGVRRALFLDADVLARVDVGELYSTELTQARFIAAARRCASKRSAYQPHFKFHDELVKELGLKSNAMLVNAGVLLMDLEAYCNAQVIESLKAVLRRHIAGPPLWRDGNNQPPFTIAAAKHISFVDPSWNVRMGDAKGQAQVARNKRRRRDPSTRSDECTAMLQDPWILHAHFKPCDALPDYLCPNTSPASSSTDEKDSPAPSSHKKKYADDPAKALKLASLRTKNTAKNQPVSVPCQCKDVDRVTKPVSYRRGHGRHRRRSHSSSSSSSRGNGGKTLSPSSSGDQEDDASVALYNTKPKQQTGDFDETSVDSAVNAIFGQRRKRRLLSAAANSTSSNRRRTRR